MKSAHRHYHYYHWTLGCQNPAPAALGVLIEEEVRIATRDGLDEVDSLDLRERETGCWRDDIQAARLAKNDTLVLMAGIRAVGIVDGAGSVGKPGVEIHEVFHIVHDTTVPTGIVVSSMVQHNAAVVECAAESSSAAPDGDGGMAPVLVANTPRGPDCDDPLTEIVGLPWLTCLGILKKSDHSRRVFLAGSVSFVAAEERCIPYLHGHGASAVAADVSHEVTSVEGMGLSWMVQVPVGMHMDLRHGFLVVPFHM